MVSRPLSGALMGPYKFYKQYGKRRYERWPRPHETVIDRERDDRGPYGHGSVVQIDRENQQVMVKFRAPPGSHLPVFILVYDGNIHWDAREGKELKNPYYVDLNSQFEEASCDELITYQFYSFDDLKWSSHVSGVGAWITTGSYP